MNGHRLLRRSEVIIQEMTSEECHEFLKRMRFGRVACARDNQPYVVPIYFAYDGKHLYCFSTTGQKIEWMRKNPLVCVEVDEIVAHLDWRSVVVMGRYEELSDVPSNVNVREYALELLQQRPMFWQPAYVATEHRGSPDALIPVFYRIQIDQITGHRGLPDPIEAAAARCARARIRPRPKWFFSQGGGR